jgi:hypothetical protein
MESYKLAVVYRAYQEGLHDVARERSATPQRSAPSLLARARRASHLLASWLGGQMLQVRGQQRVRIAPPSHGLTMTSVAVGSPSSVK